MLKRRQSAKYFSVATSHHPRLVEGWLERYGEAQATELLKHGLKLPPTLVHAPGAEAGERHARPPFVVWRGDHGALRSFLDARADRWVQDPSAYAVVEATERCGPRLIVDYCAGRGTKTLGLASRHADARIIATDVHTGRLEDLRHVAERASNVEAVAPEAIAAHGGGADLVLVDVPCTNTGVLARRPEAKYRFSRRAVDSVIATQRAIVAEAVTLLAPGGVLAYSTCSVEPIENDRQVEWACDRFGLTLMDAAQHLPTGEGPTYQDGSYYALLRRSS
jgi:16S rRNA (cytosine967-C5)-methyltransferase